jgi:monoamine oxidase
VGAGLSGLSAARRLRQGGATVVVLEARDRAGGKMHTAEVGGCPVDLGAHWVGPKQRRILALAEELGIAVHEQYLDGEHLLNVGGKHHSYRGNIPRGSALGMLEAGLGMARVEVRRRLVDRDEPWRSRGAARLDSYTLGHWIDGLRSREARAFFELTARTVFGAEPSELSFLFFLWYAQSAGGMFQLTDFAGGAQDSHLEGGSQQVCDRIAAELGDAVVLSSPVSSIVTDGNGAVVTSAARTVRAGRVIVAVSPVVAARIEFEPALTPPREALSQRMPMGAYMKGIGVYERAWWRDRGLSGLAFADRGPVQFTVDVSPPGGEPGILAGFVTGAPARAMGRLAPGERREAVLSAMAAALAPEAADPVAYRDFNWLEERWSRGGPVGLMGPGTLTTLGPVLREPAGPVHWAGTDTAREWNGYMEGAIEAGERAAAEV